MFDSPEELALGGDIRYWGIIDASKEEGERICNRDRIESSARDVIPILDYQIRSSDL